MNTAFRRNAFIFKANPKDIENDKLPILILVTGQSNSLNSTTPGVTGDGDVQDHPNIWTYEHFPDVDQTQGWKFGFKTSPDYPIDPGVGNAFDYHVAKHLEKTTGRPVLIAKQSAGGQGVAEWLPSGGGIPGATGSMFSSVSAMFEAAIAAPLPFRRDNKSLIDLGISTADYMLWHQGEADADYRPNPARNGEGEYIETFKSVLSVFLNPSINGSSAAPKINENTQIVVGELLIGGNSPGNPTDDRNTDLERIASQIENVSFSNNINNEIIDRLLNDYFIVNKYKNNKYNASIAESIEEEISNLIQSTGVRFFEINNLVKLKEGKADLLFEVRETQPVYVNNININGNTRTLDYVIRRELEITEGDAFLTSELNKITKKIKSLRFFEEVNVEKKLINDKLVDIDIRVKENQTGTFTAGASFGTLDGVTLVTGLNESNIGGTGRSLEFMINNSNNNNEYTFNTTDKFFLNRDMDLSFGLSYKERDYSRSSSYQLDQYQASTGLSYKFQDNLYHSVKLFYELDDIFVTDSNTASSTIIDVQGGSAKFILENGITYSTLNSFFFPRNGNFLKFSNVFETPTSSNNGYIKNIITYKKYKEFNNDIASFQTKIGNVFSLSNSDILPNDKFSLGGRWLRGFDNYGVGPRNSRTSYIGGNNILATKIDYSKLMLKNDDNPIYFNFFNDIGIVWDNKTSPTDSNESIRSSAGFGIKFYSFIGPIAFTWGFPIEDESYDIKRMFTFSIGNIN